MCCCGSGLENVRPILWSDLTSVRERRAAATLTFGMVELKQTEHFRKWRTKLKDDRARAAIALRLARLAYGHAGDSKSVGCGVTELRIHYGPGYRIYVKRRGDLLIVLLCGGDKSSQANDIRTAFDLADQWRD